MAFRRDRPPDIPEVSQLATALAGAEGVVATGIILLELLQGFIPPSTERTLEELFSAMTLVEPRRDDYAAGARLGRTCREAGIQLGTVDSLIAQLAITHELTLLTTDHDFAHAAKHIPLKLWIPPAAE